MTFQPDIEPQGESSISIQAGPIFDEASRDLAIWEQNRTSEFSGNFGSRVRIGNFSPLLNMLVVNAGTDSVSKHTNFPTVELSAGFSLNEQSVKAQGGGYFGDVPVQELMQRLAEKGLTGIHLQKTPTGRQHISFQLGSQGFKFDIGFPSLETHLKDWEGYKIGTQPTSNSFMHLEVTSPNDKLEFPKDRNQFVQLCSQFASASSRVISTLHEFYNLPMPKVQIALLSPDNQRNKEQQERGYSITTYQEGEFHWDGVKADPIYRPLDRLVWERHQREISQNRGLGNRQIVTIFKDQAIFGRWAGIAAGDQQADILIDQDISPSDLQVKGERAVSRRHFAVHFNPDLNKAFAEKSGGLIDDLVTIEDLHSLNGTKIFRRTKVARYLFESDGELRNGQRSILLPGDFLLIIPADYQRANPEDPNWFESKGIGLVYLGKRRFVKLQIAPGSTSTREFLRELAAVIAPAGEGAKMQDLVDEITDPSRQDFDILDQVRQVVRDFERKSASAVELTDEMIVSQTTDELLRHLGTMKDPEIKNTNARRIVEQRTEVVLVSYALLQLISQEQGVEKLTTLFLQNDVWKRISPEVCLYTLDLIEGSNIASEVKKQILNSAFMARDDATRNIIRVRLARDQI